MDKFRGLKITFATVLCLIGGNRVSNSTVNADTSGSTQIENKVSENSKREDIEDEDEVHLGSGELFAIFAMMVCFPIVAFYLKQSLDKKPEYPHGEICFKVINGIPTYYNKLW